MGNHTTAGNGCLDERVQFLVSPDGQLQVPGSDALHFQILRCVPCKLKYLSRQVLQDRRSIDSRSGTNTLLVRDSALEKTVDTSDGELQPTDNKIW